MPSHGPLAVGERVPDFRLKLASVDGVADFHLAERLGGKPLVFSFFPMAFTRVCTTQMCEMRDHASELAADEAQVFGFSSDTPAVNKEFARAHQLPHGILCDPNYEVLPRLWRLATVAGVTSRAMRGVMIVGPDGLVRWTRLHDVSGEWMGVAEIRRHLS